MDLHVLALVLLAAAGHAGWNAWLKTRGAGVAGFATLALGWLLAGVIGVLFTGLPAAGSWTWLLASCAVHTAYALLLIRAYRVADFSLAYPIARGSGPLIISLTAPYLLQENLQGPGQFAVALLVLGIFMIGMFRGPAGVGGRRAVMLSLATGAMIAGYTMIDAEGARAGARPHAYAAWLFVTTSIPILILAWRHYGDQAVNMLRRGASTGIAAGVLSVAAYWIVIWAMTVAPTALVAATRESSILFAALLGWLFLGERITPVRWVGIALMLAGLLLAKL